MTDPRTTALTELNALSLSAGNTASNRAHLANAKMAIRSIPAPAQPVEPPPIPPLDLRPWVNPIKAASMIGAAGATTVLDSGSYAEVAFKGRIRVPLGTVVQFDRCSFVGPHGLGAGGTLLEVAGGVAELANCELTGSEGRSGLYLSGGKLLLRDPWLHDNGVGGGKQYQQLYVAGCDGLTIEGGLVENGEDNGVQLYSPPEYDQPVENVSIENLEVRNCKQSGLQIARRVHNLLVVGLNSHGNAYGVRGYEPETSNCVVRDSHLWGNGRNVYGTGFAAQGIVEEAP